MFRKQKTAATGRFEDPHVGGLIARKIDRIAVCDALQAHPVDARVEGDASRAQRPVHLHPVARPEVPRRHGACQGLDLATQVQSAVESSRGIGTPGDLVQERVAAAMLSARPLAAEDDITLGLDVLDRRVDPVGEAGHEVLRGSRAQLQGRRTDPAESREDDVELRPIRVAGDVRGSPAQN